MVNPYTVLGLRPGASQEEAKKTYRRLAHRHHPDKGGDPAKFRAVKEAWEAIERGGVGGRAEWGGVWDDLNDLMRQFGGYEASTREPRDADPSCPKCKGKGSVNVVNKTVYFGHVTHRVMCGCRIG